MKCIVRPEREIPVCAEKDIVIVGGGVAGYCAAVAAARTGADVMLVEKTGCLGGLASSGIVLLWDDMSNNGGKVVGGIPDETINRLVEIGGAVIPPEEVRYKRDPQLWDKWGSWGVTNWLSVDKEESVPIIEYAASVDPELFKCVAFEFTKSSGVELRLHSVVIDTVQEGNQLKGIIIHSKKGEEAVLAKVIVDATGDGDVFALAGADCYQGKSSVSINHRLGNINVERVAEFSKENPAEMENLNNQARTIIKGVHKTWWMKAASNDGMVWCNCPTFFDINALDPCELTKVEVESRKHLLEAIAYLKNNIPGFEKAYIVDTASMVGVRQTRLLKGEYTVTVEDIRKGRYFPDTVGRARNYYIPYRSMLPIEIDNIIVAGRCYSAMPGAQWISREIAACGVMGQAAGVAAGLAVKDAKTPKTIDIKKLQKNLMEQDVIL
jgi:hypothetical protein